MVKPYVPNIGESELAQKIGKKVSETEEILLENTNAYRYGGFKTKEARERSKLREQPVMAEPIQETPKIDENPE